MTAPRYKLCYVSGNCEGIMYFTDNLTQQCGDDWDDAPYISNASAPYERDDNKDESWNEGSGHLKMLGYSVCDWHIKGLAGVNYSVEDINAMKMPWLYNEETHTGIQYGDSINKVTVWCRKNGVKVGELK